MGNWQEGNVHANGISIHYHRTGGNKPAVVLAHGFTDNGLCWARVAQALQSDYDVVMYDARNHGKSERHAVADNDLEHDCRDVIRGLELERPALIGHSMGAGTAARMAARYPEMIRCAVLEDPPWSPAIQGTARAREARLADFRKWIAGLNVASVEEIAEFGRRQSPTWHHDDLPAWAESKKQVNLDVMPKIGEHAWQDDARAIAVPTLLLYADPQAGGIVSHEAAREAESLNPRIRAQHIPGAGHNIRREQFEPFITVVGEFLNESAR